MVFYRVESLVQKYNIVYLYFSFFVSQLRRLRTFDNYTGRSLIRRRYVYLKITFGRPDRPNYDYD